MYLKKMCRTTKSSDILSLCSSFSATTQKPSLEVKLDDIKKYVKENARKHSGNELLIEKYRQDKITRTQEKYEMANKIRKNAKERQDHLFFQSDSFRRRKAFPSFLDSLKYSITNLLSPAPSLGSRRALLPL